MAKAKTIDLKGKAYAQVPERIRIFREENPNGDISTEPKIQADGRVIFKATVLKDKSKPESASATGHAIGKVGAKEKDFEKLETISVGRALAMLGYLASGDVASSEEMEEFLKEKGERTELIVTETKAKMEKIKNLDELKKLWGGLSQELRDTKMLEDLKNSLKTKYENS